MDTLTMLVGIIGAICVFLIGKWIGTLITNARWQANVQHIRDGATKQSRAVLSGQISEQLAPFLPGFAYKTSEARFLGKPNDFIIFKGMDNNNIEEIIFVEVKSGDAQLSPRQISVQKAIENKKISFYEYRIPKARQ